MDIQVHFQSESTKKAMVEGPFPHSLRVKLTFLQISFHLQVVIIAPSIFVEYCICLSFNSVNCLDEECEYVSLHKFGSIVGTIPLDWFSAIAFTKEIALEPIRKGSFLVSI